MFELKNKRAVITGGGSGIGKATALLFVKQGASVVIIDKNANSEASVMNELDIKSPIKYFTCDVSNFDEVHKIMSEIGRVDILVNSAGVSHIGNIESTSGDDVDRLYNVNVKGVYNTMKAVIPSMKENQKGVILNLASIAGLVGLPDRFAYSMTKGAVLAMTMSVAKDYINQGIRCNSISPARVHTAFVDGFLSKHYPGKENEMFEKLSKTQPIGRMAKQEEVAALILYLCSDEAAFITGCDYPIDGGFIKLNN
jgi:2-keto-3-deoxy-L-fuconate dehydrogenase